MSFLRILLWPLRNRSRTAQPAPPVPPQPAKLTIEQYESVNPIVVVSDGATEVSYCTPNRATKWRVDTLFTKEPDTIEWIRSFQPGETLVDIGANVGMYTIWAAKTRGVRVFAFEPESQNFALLCKNIVVNQLGKLATAYPAALSDREEFSLLHLSGFELGGSCHSFGETLDYNLQPHAFAHTQGCYSTTLDLLVSRGAIPVPNYIKIDVDGLEHKVLAGCANTLKDSRVRSVLVEINTRLAEHQRIIEDMRNLGFQFSSEQVAAALRKEGPFTGVGNHVFHR